MLKKFLSDSINLAKTKTAKDAWLVLLSNFVSAACGLVVMIILARKLGPAEFGLFSVAVSVISIASQFTDLGISTGLIKFVSEYLHTDKKRADIILKISFELKIILGFIIFVIGWLLAGMIATDIFHKPELTYLLKIAFLGSYMSTLLGFVISELQAYQLFKKYSYINAGWSIFKILLTVLLLYFGLLNLNSSLWATILPYLFGFIVGWFFIDKSFLKSGGDRKENFWKLIHFSKWVTISTFATMVIMQLDILMITAMKSTTELGYYSSAYRLAFVFPLITSTLATVLLPKVASFKDKKSIINYLKKIINISIWLIPILAVLVILSKPLVLLLFGIEYQSSILIFQILLVSFVFSIVINPISYIFYNINKPQILSYLNIAQLILNIVGNLILINMFGVIGAAISTLLVRILGMVVVLIYIAKFINSSELRSI